MTTQWQVMTGEDTVIVIDEDRVGEAEALDRVRDLADLLTGMGPGVALGRMQAVDRTDLEVAGLHGNLCCC